MTCLTAYKYKQNRSKLFEHLLLDECKHYCTTVLKKDVSTIHTLNDINDFILVSFYQDHCTIQTMVDMIIQHPEGIFLEDLCDEVEKLIKLCRLLYIFLNTTFSSTKMEQLSKESKDTIEGVQKKFYDLFIKGTKQFISNIVLRCSTHAHFIFDENNEVSVIDKSKRMFYRGTSTYPTQLIKTKEEIDEFLIHFIDECNSSF